MRSLQLIVLFLLLTACTSVGPRAMRQTYPQYNEAVRDVGSEELLLNIVRTRYLDPIKFLQVGTVSAQFSVDLGAGFEGGISEEKAQALGTGDLGYRDAPTLTFTPRQDSAFTKLLTQPLASEIFSAMAVGEEGWSWALLLAGLSINGAENELLGGQQDEFDQRMRILDGLNANGHLAFGTTMDTYPVSEPLPRAALRPTDLIYAAEKGYRFEAVDEENVRLMGRKRRTAIRIHEQSLAQVAPQLEALGLDPSLGVYPIRRPAEMGKEVSQSDALYIQTRSMLGMLRVLAGGVEIPCEHQRAGLAPEAAIAGVPMGIRELFRVRVCRQRPQARLATCHRGYWFYLDDRDDDSRLIFYMLTLFYDLQLGVESSSSTAPILTLPLG